MSGERLTGGVGAAIDEAASEPVRLKKAPNAFRTISEVADELQIPQHVLRFWETKFPQVRPLKRGGGRRYYRPDDIALLRRISDLLYTQGYTIKGVQRLLRDGGGKLSDDIPPPTEAERLASEAERAVTDAQPPEDVPPDAAPATRELSQRSPDRLAPGHAASGHAASGRQSVEPAPADPLVALLRARLAAALVELEALRRMIGEL